MAVVNSVLLSLVPQDPFARTHLGYGRKVPKNVRAMDVTTKGKRLQFPNFIFFVSLTPILLITITSKDNNYIYCHDLVTAIICV